MHTKFFIQTHVKVPLNWTSLVASFILFKIPHSGDTDLLTYADNRKDYKNKTKVIRANLMNFDYDLDLDFENFFRFCDILFLVTF